MARGKNTRRRASLDSPPSPTSTLMTPSSSSSSPPDMISRLGSGNGNSSFYHAGAKTASTLPPPGTLNPVEVQESIDFHWKNLSFELRDFLLKNAHELSLHRLVSYWTKPSQIENTSANIAASICGCSWYLALQYMSIGKVIEARALILSKFLILGSYIMLVYQYDVHPSILYSSDAHFYPLLIFLLQMDVSCSSVM